MRIAARHRRKSPRECQVAGCITDKQNVRLRLEKSGSEMTILNPVSKEEAQRYPPSQGVYSPRDGRVSRRTFRSNAAHAGLIHFWKRRIVRVLADNNVSLEVLSPRNESAHPCR